MASEKTLAIVLRVVDFSETSCVVTLFTHGFGKISALAKGARRPKSPFESALDLLAVCRIVFLHKTSDALDLLTEAKLERRFHAAQRSLPRLYAGYYVAELLREMTDTADPHPDLFVVADETLKRLDTGGPPVPTLIEFELAALQILGHLPALFACAACGQPIGKIDKTRKERIPFGIQAGGVLCRVCRPGQRHVIGITKQSLLVLQQLAKGEQIAESTLETTPAVRGEIRGVMNQYFRHLLGHPLRMHDYLVQI